MSSIDPNVDPYAYLGMVRNPNGSITRKPASTLPPQYSDSENPIIHVLTKDIIINPQNNTWARVYLPRQNQTSDGVVPTKKLPLIIYYHGGGFVVGSVNMALFHKFCADVATNIPAVVVSVEYRLAPEHRLPAAYDDCVEALHWIKTTSDDDWLITKFADFSNCFLMGSSAGANIAYHVGLRVVACVEDLLPIKIQGLILHHPYFGGVQRTSSELRLVNDRIIPSSLTDIMWELSLPVGVDRDHEYCNPMVGIKSDALEKIKDQGWRVLVTGYSGDACIDRQIEMAKMWEEKGLGVVGVFSDGGSHGIEFFDDSKAVIFHSHLKNFVLSLGMF